VAGPERFVQWLGRHDHTDKWGNTYRYHPRSDAHSIALCELILADLLGACPPLAAQAARGEVAYGINLAYHWAGSGKDKTIDLAVGTPAEPVMLAPGPIARVRQLADVRLSLEAKSCMTEHGKSRPRLWDELSSSHEIVHRGNRASIAAGVCVVNIAPSFASPLRNQHPGITEVTTHNQPHAAQAMVAHLRDLPIRENLADDGLEGFAQIVVDCDNLNGAALWTDPPAPQPGDFDHYVTFVARLARFYGERFA